MKIGIASDHGGYELKEELKKTLTELRVDFDDCGVYDETSVDYPEIARKLCQAILDKKYDRGILLCGTGIGVSIVANRLNGIRAAVCSDVFSAVMSREHNDANVLCMGGRVIGSGLASMIMEKWLCTEFAAGRHARRVCMIDE